MKIQPDHLATLKEFVTIVDTPRRRAQYERGDFARADLTKDVNKRYRWDLLWASGLYLSDGVGSEGLPLYAYLTDEHIDTALRSFVPPLNLPVKA